MALVDVAEMERRGRQGQASGDRMDRLLAMANSSQKKLEREIKHSSELSERLARMEHVQGQLEEKCAQATAQLSIANTRLAKEQRRRAAAEANLANAAPPAPLSAMHQQEFDRLRAEVARLGAENSRLRVENRNALRELSCLDQSFFEEIEDLKFGLQEARVRNKAYETTLRELAKSMGVPFSSLKPRV